MFVVSDIDGPLPEANENLRWPLGLGCLSRIVPHGMAGLWTALCLLRLANLMG